MERNHSRSLAMASAVDALCPSLAARWLLAVCSCEMDACEPSASLTAGACVRGGGLGGGGRGCGGRGGSGGGRCGAGRWAVADAIDTRP